MNPWQVTHSFEVFNDIVVIPSTADVRDSQVSNEFLSVMRSGSGPLAGIATGGDKVAFWSMKGIIPGNVGFINRCPPGADSHTV